MIYGNIAAVSLDIAQKSSFPASGSLEQLKLLRLIRQLADGFSTFISGMARGVGLWSGEIIIEKRRFKPTHQAHCRKSISRV
jgi:hypothetical protein